nr:FAE3 [uncultured bacterium]
MALIQMDFFSKSLSRLASVNVLLPNDSDEEQKADNAAYERNMKTLYLLHGYTGNRNDWLLNSRVSEISSRYNLAVVCPSGENSFYTDAPGAGRAFGQYIGRELVDYCRQTFGLSLNRADTFIGGLSMGGFGALRNALQYNQTFGKVFALSSALIIHNIKGMREGDADQIADYAYYRSVFGDLAALEESPANPEYWVRKMAPGCCPAIYMACGRDDFLIEENRAFKSFLDTQKIPVRYTEDDGEHDWDYWNRHLEPAVRWLLDE